MTPAAAAIICIVAALPLLMHVGMQTLFGGVASDVRTALDATSASMGVMAATVYVPSILISPGSGALVDRFGARRTLVAATTGFALCWAWFASSTSVPNSIAARASMGVCASFFYPGFIAVTTRLVAPQGRQGVISLMQMGIGLVAVTSSLLATRVLASDAWRTAFLFPAAVAIPITIALWHSLGGASLRGRREAGGSAPPLSIAQVLRRADIRNACIVAFGTGGIMLALGGLLNGVAARVIWNLPEGSWGLVNAAFYLGYAVGGLVLARAVRGFGVSRVLRGSLAFLAASLAAWCYMPMSVGTPAAVVMTLCCGLGTSAMSVAVAVAVRSVPMESTGVASGIVTAAMSLSGFTIQAGAMASTLVPGTTPLGRAQTCAGLVLGVVVLAYAAARRIRDEPSHPQA
jgi:MFS family permease